MFAGAAAYSTSLDGPFVFDDIVSIVTNGSIRSLGDLAVLVPPRELPVSGRPLVNLSLAINYAAGGLAVRGYHAVNVALHLLCALALFGVARSTLALDTMPDAWRARSLPVAFAGALLWVLHPLNTEAVDYVTQRTETMMALCYLLTVYGAIRAHAPARRTAWTMASIAACTAGMAGKETMATVPAAVALYDRAFLFPTWSAAWRARRLLYGALALSSLWLLVWSWSGPRIHSAGFGAGVSSWTYLLNQSEIITRYLRLAAWPTSLVVNYGPPRPVGLIDVAPYVVFVGALAVLTIAAGVRWRRASYPAAWFFLTLAPASSIVPIATEAGAERRMYLPLAGVIFCALVVGIRVWDRWRERQTPARDRDTSAAPAFAALAIVALLLATGTWARHREYRSPLTLAQTVLERRPGGVAHLLVGTELLNAGDRARARPHLVEAARTDARAWFFLGREDLADGRLAEAIAALQQFVALEPLRLEVLPARLALGTAFSRQGRWADAADQFRLVLAMDRHRIDARHGLGDALLAQGLFHAAAEHLAEVVQAAPNDIAALTSLGISESGAGRPDAAVNAFRRAVSIDGRNGASRRNLANALLDAGRFAEAEAEAREAARLLPGDPVVQELLALARAHGQERRLP